MTNRLQTSMPALVVALSFLYLLAACNDTEPVGIKSDKSEVLKIHLVLSDENGKPLVDTTYEASLSSRENSEEKIAVFTTTPPTGGSSRCSAQMTLTKTSIDDPNNKRKAEDDDDKK